MLPDAQMQVKFETSAPCAERKTTGPTWSMEKYTSSKQVSKQREPIPPNEGGEDTEQQSERHSFCLDPDPAFYLDEDPDPDPCDLKQQVYFSAK